MTAERMLEARRLEGSQIGVALEDGSRIDDCQLISAGRHGIETLWLFADGVDLFVTIATVRDVWEVRSPCRAAA